MTPNQKDQFNAMREALRSIASDYETVEQMRRNPNREDGLDFELALEYAYDNIQETARQAVKGVRNIR